VAKRVRIHVLDGSSDRMASDRVLSLGAEFIAEGLELGEAALVIATEPQHTGLLRRLDEMRLDLAGLQRIGQLTVVDIQSLFDDVIIDGFPDETLFATRVGALIEQSQRACSTPLVRIFSGMVEWLWHQQRRAALQIEAYFYGLARTHAFSLLCAHAMGERAERARRIGGTIVDAVAINGTGSRSVSSSADRRLSVRQRDVLHRAALGHANKDIANALGISVRTVEAHKAHAMRKLGFVERADIVRFAVEQGWLTDL
jgi:DNA-binding CsgD family transcriptional regulator